MNLRERRSMQRRGWIGLVVLAALPIGGIMLLSGRLSLFFVAVVAALLCTAIAISLVLLYANVRVWVENRRVAASGKPS